MRRILQNQPTALRRRIYFVAVSENALQTRRTGIANASFLVSWSKNGATPTAKAGTVVEVGNGRYYYEPTVGECDTIGKVTPTISTTGLSPNIEPREYEIEIVAVDQYDGVRGGMTALPNTAAGVSSGLPIVAPGSGSGGLFLNASGEARADLYSVRGGTTPTPNTTGIPLVEVDRWRNAQPASLISVNGQAAVRTNVDGWYGQSVPATAVTGVPIVDVKYQKSFELEAPALVGGLNLPSVAVRGWRTDLVPVPTVTGVPKVDVTHFGGTAAPAPTVAGIPKVEATGGGGGVTLADLARYFGVRATGWNVIKTGTTNAYDAGAFSEQSFAGNGRVETTVRNAGDRYFVGLSDVDTDATHTTIDYAWYIYAGTAQCFEGGVGSASTPAAVGDVFTIERLGTDIVYKKTTPAGTVTTVKTTGGVSAVTPLFVDTSVYSRANAAREIRLSVNGLYLPLSWTGLTGVVVAPSNAIEADTLSDGAIDKIAAGLEGITVEGGVTLGDAMRLLSSILAGPVQNFSTGSLEFKSLDGSKIRAYITTSPVGRLTLILGDLTP